MGNDVGSKAHVKLMCVFCMNSLTLIKGQHLGAALHEMYQNSNLFTVRFTQKRNVLFFGHLPEIWNESQGGKTKVRISFSRCLG